MQGRTERAFTMLLAIVLALGAVIWVMVTQTRSSFPVATRTATPTLAMPFAPQATSAIPGTLSPTPSEQPNALNFFLVSYQAFENGFMLQRIGEACVYAYRTTPGDAGIILSPALNEGQPREYAYCIGFDGLAELPLDEDVRNLFGEYLPFRLVWGTYAPVQSGLGKPVAELVDARSALLPTPPVRGSPYYTPIAYLPDGRLFQCGSSAATAGTCQIGE
ncbi:MAG: hypothetical protein JNL42_22975 [Anaerolineae bacterium]|nr:hypothetical protein [Anaerolineae bacterium]